MTHMLALRVTTVSLTDPPNRGIPAVRNALTNYCGPHIQRGIITRLSQDALAAVHKGDCLAFQ